MKFIVTFFILSLSFPSLFSLEVKGITPDEAVVYKKTDKAPLKLHFFYPKGHKKKDGKKRATVVFFFGGGWNGGSASQFFPFCQHLASKGMIAVSADYRTKKSHGVTPKECVKDGKSAVRWLRQHAEVYGIDPQRLAAGGGSAGGHVAASTATTTKFEEETEDKSISSWPDLLLLFNPVLDNSKEGYGYSRVKSYWQDFSPMHNINDKTPGSIFFLGSKDSLIPVKTGEKWKEKISQQGKKSELHVWEGEKHGFFNPSKCSKEVYQDILSKLDAFLLKNKFL